MRHSLLAALVVASFSAPALAVSFANQVVSYTPGAGVGVYNNPAAALGGPDGLTGENTNAQPYFAYPNTLSPFSPAYQDDEIVQIGEGGSITLRLERYIIVGAGPAFGVIENVSLIDPDYPNGTTTLPAMTFGEDRALVEVSKDGVTFVGLTGGAPTDVLFDMPALYYANAGPYDTAAPGAPSFVDFGKPFTPAGGLSAFDGKASYADVVAVFDGSAGGTWLDASASGLDQIAYIRLSVPDDDNPATTLSLELDAILTNASLLGAFVPEPASLLAAALLAPMMRRRR